MTIFRTPNIATSTTTATIATPRRTTNGRSLLWCRRRQSKILDVLLFLFAILQIKVVVSWLLVVPPVATSTSSLSSSTALPSYYSHPSTYNTPSVSSLTRRSSFMTATDIMTAVVETTTNHDDEKAADHSSQQQPTQKRLICIRHARSEGNEFMARPGNHWGDPTFRDDPTLIDAKLTETGMKQVQDELLPKFLLDNDDDVVADQDKTTTGVMMKPHNNNNNNDDYNYYADLLQQVDLIIVSPLTRTQQTFQYGVLPALQKLQQKQQQQLPPILAHPLSTERVYTASDTGRSVDDLAQEFPWVDWSLMSTKKTEWWYSTTTSGSSNKKKSYQEWRPHGQGQWYAVPGEPTEDFNYRMKLLEEWIAAREEHTILLVTHWGVIHYLTGGYDAANCEVKVLHDWKPLHQQLQQREGEGIGQEENTEE